MHAKGDGCSTASPYVGNGNNVRNINPSGNVNNNNANNSNGVAPDCENSRHGVSGKPQKRVRSRKERSSCSPGKGDEYTDTDAVSFNEAGTATDSTFPITPKEKICSFEELYKAAFICKRNVMWKDSVAGFIKNALTNCCSLHEELTSGRYRLSPYSIFEVHEKKTRTIVSTKMRDRVVQRSLCDNYLTQSLSRGFVYDNCACLPGKGSDFARDRLKCHLQRFYRKHGLSGYVLKVDIHDFFGSTPHDTVKAAVAKRVPDPWVRDHVFMIVDSFNNTSPYRGMGLGSQITQLVQLAVLDDLDHYIKEVLRIKGYVRYMDDFVLIHESKEHLRYSLNEITRRLSFLGLEVNQKKTVIQPVNQGIHFLGFSFRLIGTGKVIKTLLHKKVSKERRKLRKLADMVKEGKMGRKHADECYQAWKSHVTKGNCKNLLSRMDSFYKGLYKEGGNVQVHTDK